MECRRCGKELPVGQRTTCPYCGIYLNTFVTPRGPAPKSKRTGNRALIMSFLSVGLVVAVVVVFVPFMRNVTKNQLVADIQERYDLWYGNEAEFSEDDWEKNLAVFSGLVAKLEDSYPKDTDNIEMARRYLNILCGLDPDDPTQPLDPGKDQRAENELLIRRAKEELLDITGFSFDNNADTGSLSLTIQAKNCSPRLLSQLRICIQIFKTDGTPSNGSGRSDNPNECYLSIISLLPGQEESSYFSIPWSNKDAAVAKIVWMEATYTDQKPIFFPTEVCEVLWP